MIELKSLDIKNETKFHEWINDDVAIQYSLSKFQKISSKKEITNWYASLLSNSSDYVKGVFLKTNSQLIGYAGICKLSQTNKSGEYFIFIGERTQWGKGIGTFVTRHILEHGFKQLGLNRIMLTVSEPNKSAIRAYEKAGFKIEGKLRESCFRNNKYHDKIIMSVLKSEFDALNEMNNQICNE